MRPVLQRCLIAAFASVAGISAAPAASLNHLARDIAELDPQLSTLWPGYWPPGQPFVLYRNGRCVMRSSVAPAADFAAVDTAPDLYAGRCGDARFRGPMVLGEAIAGVEAPAVQISGRRADLDRTATFLLHEAFHDFQSDAFKDADRISTDFGFPLDEDLVRMKLRESSFLLSAADTDDRARQIALVRAAIATRKARLARMPAAAETIEDQYLRYEGTAEYVSMRTRAIVRGSEEPAKYLQDRLKTLSRNMGRTWEYMLRWQGYVTGAAAGLLLDRWEVDWKPHVAAGMPLYAILETASGYSDAEAAALLEASARADVGGVHATARQLVRGDIAAGKALARFERASDFTLSVRTDTEGSATFDTTEMHTIADGVLVMTPSPFNSAIDGVYELSVRARPIRMWNAPDEAPLGEAAPADHGLLRYDIALPKAPAIEGCDAPATRCGAGTRIRARGIDLTLFADHVLEHGENMLVVRPVETSAQAEQVDGED
ncbi:hypothetical protein [Chiayiivirga flava]|uniref:Uncharacterized protein n=1 Tax=Chiayiivirga flava TaxID=659595 RepID=A0A7W8D790_9GAMM|nr:hypothetical protein [Chiayiivirga flava]MBB5209209.1 hypothetical protein [Chiayiivirga flava]